MSATTKVTGTIHRDDGTTVEFVLDQNGWMQHRGDWGSGFQVEAMRNGLIASDVIDWRPATD